MEALEYKYNGDKLEGLHYTNSRLIKKQVYKLTGSNVGDSIDSLVELGRKSGRGIKKLYTVNSNKDLILHYRAGVVKLNDFQKCINDRAFTDFRRQLKHKLENKKIAEKFNKRSNKNIAEPKVFRAKRTKKITKLGKTIITVGLVVVLGLSASKMVPDNYQTKVNDQNSIETVEVIKNDEQPIVESAKEEEKDIQLVSLDYEYNSESSRVKNVKEKYGEMIEKYANRYGIDPEIMYAVAAQESSGNHDESLNRNDKGLFQVSDEVWSGHTFRPYNVETGEYETFTLGKIDGHGKKDKNGNANLTDAEMNTRAACAIMQASIISQNYNIALGIQNYNYGGGNMSDAYGSIEKYTNSSISKVRTDSKLTSQSLRIIAKGSDYSGVTAGDSKYVPHVAQFIKEGTELEFRDKDGSIYTIVFTNEDVYNLGGNVNTNAKSR